MQNIISFISIHWHLVCYIVFAIVYIAFNEWIKNNQKINSNSTWELIINTILNIINVIFKMPTMPTNQQVETTVKDNVNQAVETKVEQVVGIEDKQQPIQQPTNPFSSPR